jgi:hypothetical protein
MNVDPTREAAKRFYALLLDHHILARDATIVKLTEENAKLIEMFGHKIITCSICRKISESKYATTMFILVNNCTCSMADVCSPCARKEEASKKDLPKCHKGHTVCPSHSSAFVQCDYCDVQFKSCQGCTPLKCRTCEGIAHSRDHLDSNYGNCSNCRSEIDKLKATLKKRPRSGY